MHVCMTSMMSSVEQTYLDFKIFVALVTNIFFFDLGFTAHQEYFTHFEPSQSLGGAKMGDP